MEMVFIWELMEAQARVQLLDLQEERIIWGTLLCIIVIAACSLA